MSDIIQRNWLLAGNGHEACTAVRTKHYDIVLMDCQMPEMDGYEGINLIRQWELEQGKNRIPIIALTANATKKDVQKCFDCRVPGPPPLLCPILGSLPNVGEQSRSRNDNRPVLAEPSRMNWTTVTIRKISWKMKNR